MYLYGFLKSTIYMKWWFHLKRVCVESVEDRTKVASAIVPISLYRPIVINKLIAFSKGARFSISTLFFYAAPLKCERQHVRG